MSTYEAISLTIMFVMLMLALLDNKSSKNNRLCVLTNVEGD